MTNLILGTANFGNNYGITNGIINQKSTKKILDLAKKKNIKTIDTAYLYNNSYEALSIANIGDFRITTKTPKFLEFSNENELLNSLYKFIDKTDELLGLKNVEAILFHNSADLSSKYGSLLYKKLKELTKSYNVKIGISVYDEAELLLANEYDIDIVQAPLNIFDQRFIKSGWLKKLKNDKKEVHLRSIFLQGLLLKNSNNIFNKLLKKKMINFENLVKKNNSKKIDLCIDYIKTVKYVDKVILGFDSLQQLQTIIKVLDKKKKNIDYNQFCNIKTKFVDPRKWKKILVSS